MFIAANCRTDFSEIVHNSLTANLCKVWLCELGESHVTCLYPSFPFCKTGAVTGDSGVNGGRHMPPPATLDASVGSRRSPPPASAGGHRLPPRRPQTVPPVSGGTSRSWVQSNPAVLHGVYKALDSWRKDVASCTAAS